MRTSRESAFLGDLGVLARKILLGVVVSFDGSHWPLCPPPPASRSKKTPSRQDAKNAKEENASFLCDLGEKRFSSLVVLADGSLTARPRVTLAGRETSVIWQLS
jgi:hypothetical protein